MNKHKKNTTRPTLFIWREVPIDVDTEMYNLLIEKWKAPVYIICMKGELSERKKVGIKTLSESIILDELTDGDLFARQLITQNPGAVHIFAGMLGPSWRYAKYCYKVGNRNIITLGERPDRRYSLILDCLSHLINCLRYYRYKKMVKARIQMSSLGVQSAINFGWKREMVFPFMYCPNNQNTNEVDSNNNLVRFLYLGRFAKKHKGIGVLMRAVDALTPEGWSLDFVGGYGKDKVELINWAKNKNNIKIYDSWKQEDIVKNMKRYDVVIIPSTYDGWNLNANYAIQAGIGCIISDQAGSADLIINNKTGYVFRSDNVNDLRNCMQKVIKAPCIIESWKENTNKIRPLISTQSVSDYLLSIIEYTCLQSGKYPVCPWERLEELFE